MAILPINPRITPGASVAGDARITASLSAQIQRVEARLSAVESASAAGRIDPNAIVVGGPAGVNGATIYPASVVTAHIRAGAIDASVINASSIGAAVGTFVSINASQIVAGDIATVRLQANVVNAIQASISTLSAITANMGSITAGTITGGTVQTAASGARVVMSSSGITAFNAGGTPTFSINSGSGFAYFTGIGQLDPNSIVPSTTLSGFIGGGNQIIDSSFESTDPALNVNSTTGLATNTGRVGTFFNTTSGMTFAKSTAQSFDGTKAVLLLNGASGTGSGGANPFAGAWMYSNAVVGSPGVGAVQFPDATVYSMIQGKPCVLSAWVYVTGTDNTAGTGQGICCCYGINSAGTATLAVESPLGTAIPKNTWTRVTCKFTPNTGAGGNLLLFFRNVWTSGSNQMWVDGVQLEIADKETAYSPRPDEILYGSIRSVFIGAGEIKTNNLAAGAVTANNISLVWGGKNMAANSSVEKDLTGWSSTATSDYWLNVGGAVARVITDGYHQSNCAEITTSGANPAQGFYDTFNDMSFKAGVKYVVSLYAKSVSGNTAFNLFGGTASANNATIPVTITTSWARYTLTWTPSADVAPGTNVYIGMRSNFGAGTTAVFRVDALQIEEGELPTPYSRRPGEILTGEVGNTQIGPDSVTTDKILAGNVQATDINVSTLSAISANMGTLTAGTITGATVQTSSSSTRAEMTSAGFYVYNVGVPVFSAVGGTVSMTGALTASQLNFNGVTNSLGAASQTIRWFTGNFSTLACDISTYTDSSTFTFNTQRVYAPGTNQTSESQLIAIDAGAGNQIKWSVQMAGGGSSATVRALYNTSTSFQVGYNGDASIGRDLRVLSNFSGFGNGKIISVNSTYFQVREDFGMNFDGGNYGNMNLTSSGSAVVGLISSGASTGSGSTSRGAVYSQGGFAAWSDAKDKHSIKDVPEKAALSRVRALRPRKFKFRYGNDAPPQQYGFVAQEVLDAMPHAVERIVDAGKAGEPTETLTVHLMPLIAGLVSAVQELSECVNILRGENPDAKLSRETVKALV